MFEKTVWLTRLALLFCGTIPVHSQKRSRKGMRGSLLFCVALKVIFCLPSAIKAHSDLGGKVASWSYQ